MKLYRGFATVGGMNAFGSVLGFVRDILVAAVLGASAVSDAFFVAYRVPNMFRRIFSEGAFGTAFIPLFARRLHQEGALEARGFAARALTWIAVLSVFGVVFAEIAMPWLVTLLAPGFTADPGKFDLTVLLARIALPYLVFTCLAALYMGLLNAHGRFAVAAFSPSLFNAALIVALLGLLAAGSVEQETAAIVLVWTVAISGVLQFAVVAVAAARYGFWLKPVRPRLSPDMKQLFRLAVPGMIAGGMLQITMFVSTVIASLQDQAVSWLYYADRLFQLPVALIGAAVGIVLLPDLSHKLRSGDRDAVVASENRALEFALTIAVPAAVALSILSEPVMRVLFERGAFNAADAQVSARLLSALALGLPAFVLVKVLQPSFFAREDTRSPMLYALAAVGANGAAGFLLFQALGPVGIAVAVSLAGWINVALLAAALRARGEFILDPACRRAFAGVAAASVAMGLVLWGLATALHHAFDPANGPVVQVGALGLLIAAGLAVYFSVGAVAGAVKPRTLLKGLLGR